MKLLGVGPKGQLPLQARHDARLGNVSGASGTEDDSEGESSDGFSPKHDGKRHLAEALTKFTPKIGSFI